MPGDGSLPMPVLTAQDLAKTYGERTILAGASLAIRTRERVGLVGINGSGKSTLARILAGEETPDVGTVAVRKDARVAYLAQEPEFPVGATPRAIVLSGLEAWSRAHAAFEAANARVEHDPSERALADQAAATQQVEQLGGFDVMHRVDAILGHLGIARRDEPIDAMSGGEKRRVALARILVAQPELAILDEPTNHLDVATIEWLEAFLRDEYEGALLLITHDRYVLDRVVARTLELDRGEVYSYDGGWGEYLLAKEDRLAHEARAEQNRQNLLRRELEWMRRTPSARTGKQKARIHRAEAAIAAAPAKAERTTVLEAQTVRSGGTILDLRGVSLDIAGRRLVRDLDLSLTQGERVGIVGPNGAGKTTLLRAVTGDLAPATGTVVRGKATQIAYFDQARSGLDEEKNVTENVAGLREAIELDGREVDVRAYLSRFLFSPADQRKKVRALSGGERARVALAKLLLGKANLFLFDEPTNDLDVATLGALEDMLVSMDATVLVVTHDRYFLDRIATAILAFEGDGAVVRYAGDYTTYRALSDAREREKAQERQVEKRDVAATAKPSEKKSKGLTYGERLELEAIMPRIEGAEANVSKLEAELADPAIYTSRAAEVPAIVAALDTARADLATLMERWELLETKREA